VRNCSWRRKTRAAAPSGKAESENEKDLYPNGAYKTKPGAEERISPIPAGLRNRAEKSESLKALALRRTISVLTLFQISLPSEKLPAPYKPDNLLIFNRSKINSFLPVGDSLN
jgi:hypothetical protein